MFAHTLAFVVALAVHQFTYFSHLFYLIGSFIALKPVIESANIVKKASVQRSNATPKSAGSRPSSAPTSASRFATSQHKGGPAAARSQVSLFCSFFVVHFDEAFNFSCSSLLCSIWLFWNE
jgi:hypothetical protein